ncbi:molecular chaperone [Lysobacter sp. GCM10012299]|uniref:fimbrial biogenesis chaperone n=1 Tax=Lysobacter sp. GCM10012299 TaxID=3317333 RepID=UPI00360EFBAC
MESSTTDMRWLTRQVAPRCIRCAQACGPVLLRFHLLMRPAVLAAAILCAPFSVTASVVLDATRVILSSDRDGASVRLTNKDGVPKLIQAWIDAGNADARPEQVLAPLQVLTPIFRLEPGAGHVLRIRNLGGDEMPSDRESVYWLNVLELPPKPQGATAEGNYLQFSFRTRIKVFVRPKGVSGRPLEAPGELRWEYRSGWARATNPTPFHISISRIETAAGEVGARVMVPPFSSVEIPLARDHRQVAGDGKIAPTVLRYRSIDDYGASRMYEKPWTPASIPVDGKSGSSQKATSEPDSHQIGVADLAN